MKTTTGVASLSALFFLLISSTTDLSAQPYDGYFNGHIGMGMMKDAELFEIDDPDDVIDLGYSSDVVTSAALGLANQEYRSEIEVSYQQNDLNNLGLRGVDLDPSTMGSSGDTSALTGLVNAYYDFSPGEVLRPYISGGLGFSQVELALEMDDGVTQDSFSENDTAFAYQLGAGLGVALTETLILDLRYRYLSVQKLELDTTRFELESHNLLAGIRIKF